MCICVLSHPSVIADGISGPNRTGKSIRTQDLGICSFCEGFLNLAFPPATLASMPSKTTVGWAQSHRERQNSHECDAVIDDDSQDSKRNRLRQNYTEAGHTCNCQTYACDFCGAPSTATYWVLHDHTSRTTKASTPLPKRSRQMAMHLTHPLLGTNHEAFLSTVLAETRFQAL
jgi:hypothetical protein